MSKYVWRKRIFLTLTVLSIAFIFGQSILSRSASEQESGRIFRWLLSAISGLGLEPDPDALHMFIRKAAHFAEFAVLGICAGGYALNLGYLHERLYVALPAWLTLLVAVCDEWIQSFSGRASMVTDVMLDYAGALAGLLTVAVCVFVKNKIVRRTKHEN